MSQTTQEKIGQIVQSYPVVVFMKGTPEFPQCGFSARAVAILNDLNIPFKAVDVLADESIRQGVKEFGNWPTIPQVYVKGELIGGSDILMEMHGSGELGKVAEQVAQEISPN